MKKIIAILIFSGLLMTQERSYGQPDTLAPVRQFLHICNGYKKLPVQLEVDISTTSNWLTSPSDTAHVRARFNLSTQGTYVSMDGMEQLANDSLLLLVNHRTKRMILYPNHESVTSRLQHYLGQQMVDSSVTQLADKYRLGKNNKETDTAIIGLNSRLRLFHSTLAKQEIQVKYDPTTQQPYEVSELERSLVPVDDSIYRAVVNLEEWAGKTVSVGDSSFYLVREQTRLFRFRSIIHIPDSDPPVHMSDRIVATLPGKYQPVKTYAEYRLTQQF